MPEETEALRFHWYCEGGNAGCQGSDAPSPPDRFPRGVVMLRAVLERFPELDPMHLDFAGLCFSAERDRSVVLAQFRAAPQTGAKGDVAPQITFGMDEAVWEHVSGGGSCSDFRGVGSRSTSWYRRLDAVHGFASVSAFVAELGERREVLEGRCDYCGMVWPLLRRTRVVGGVEGVWLDGYFCSSQCHELSRVEAWEDYFERFLELGPCPWDVGGVVWRSQLRSMRGE